MNLVRAAARLLCTATVVCACAKQDPGVTDSPLGRASDAAQSAASSSDDGSPYDGAIRRDAALEVETPPVSPSPDATFDPAPYETARPLGGKSIGHTSVVFKLKLEGGVEAAYKPRSRRGKARYKGEIASYRLGRALGLSNVPPALPRSFKASELRAAVGDREGPAGKLFAEEVIVGDQGEVDGALIPWIVGLKFLPLESEPSRKEWQGWLDSEAEVPPGDVVLASQISTMLVFDYLTANWDRFSGGNVGADETRRRLLFIDNDAAFFDPPPPEPLSRQRAHVRETNRFSRSFVGALRGLSPAAAKAAMGNEKPGEPLLSDRVLAGLEERRKDALAIIDAKVAKEGEERVLAFE
jgi:hypothetical protein